jgi:hypothetical protein
LGAGNSGKPFEKEINVMAHTMHGEAEGAFQGGAAAGGAVWSAAPAYQAYQILHVGFTAAPILAGLDKFFHLLTDWDKYLAPAIANLSPNGGHSLMLVVGVVEVAAGVLTAIKPKVGAWVVAAWLLGIIINLLLIPGYFDVALRDFGLMLGALALGCLSREFDRGNRVG